MTAPAAPRGAGAVVPAPHACGDVAVLGYARTANAPAACDADAHDCAVASVLCGAFFFFAPFLTGFMSLGLGIAVLRRARVLPVADLVTAMAGALLGAANLGFWTLMTLP